MKAIILKEYGSAENFELAEIPIPPLGPGQVRIRIKAASFNPVDHQIRRGLPESAIVTSNILGRDLSGIIDEVAEGVTEFKKGDEVYSYVCNLGSSGTYTQYISVPHEIVARKPNGLSHEEAAAVPVAGITAIICLTKIQADRSKSIFIAGGAGGVGSFVISFSKHCDVKRIVTTAGNEKSGSYLMELGLEREQIIDYKSESFVRDSLLQNGGYFDAAIDLVGGKMLAACCELIGIDGQLVSIVDAPDAVSFDKLFHKNASFHSVGANAYSLSEDSHRWQTYQRVLNYITNAYNPGKLIRPKVTVVGSLSVETVKKAHHLLENNLVQGKLVMRC